jgi:hypothetical protein
LRIGSVKSMSWVEIAMKMSPVRLTYSDRMQQIAKCERENSNFASSIAPENC